MSVRHFINGNQVSVQAAYDRFVRFHVRVNGIEDREEIDSMWEQCLMSECARDDWMPDNLEMVQS